MNRIGFIRAYLISMKRCSSRLRYYWMDIVTLTGQKNILREFLNMNQSIPVDTVGQNIQKFKLKRINRSNDHLRRFKYIGALRVNR